MLRKDKKMEQDKLSLEKLRKEVEKYKRLKDEYLSNWKRERADFLNYKKQELSRIGEIVSYANTDLILKILPILDNFEIAENQVSGELINDETKGLLQIKAQLQDFLKKQGVEEIESVGKKFDPILHEAVEEIDADGQEPGMVIEEIKKGYKINERVIRVARVRVSK